MIRIRITRETRISLRRTTVWILFLPRFAKFYIWSIWRSFCHGIEPRIFSNDGKWSAIIKINANENDGKSEKAKSIFRVDILGFVCIANRAINEANRCLRWLNERCFRNSLERIDVRIVDKGRKRDSVNVMRGANTRSERLLDKN